ncbi:hypothetical protein, conserved [Angomonas deanei]|uniref:Uncharacterized protein n=1 Tax=Angomonas deanei TaxID=59799 RepID=A0A7G2CA87_9TRYP|nr:hypothetical protein, conserved [Angomonas deanei]
MSTSANGAQTDPAELVPLPVSQLNSPRGSENGPVDPVQPPSSPPAAPAAAPTGTANMSLLERLERVLSAPVKDVPLTDDSKLERALLQRMEESEELKRHPYKGTLKSFKGLLDQIEKELDHPDAKTKLKEAYIRKVEGVNPPTVEEAYIVNWALYGNVKNPSLLLAYLFINTPAELRTQLANWHFFASLFGSGQQNLIGPKLETLQLPLYPDNKLQATNESILREGSMVGGEARERRAIEKHLSTHNLIGGGPYTTVPVYTEGNDQPVAVADTTLISDAFQEVYAKIGLLEQNLKKIRTEKRAKAPVVAARRPQAAHAAAARGRGGRGRGRGARPARFHYGGGDEGEEDELEPVQEN